MKKCITDKHVFDKELKTPMIKWLQEQSTEFYEAGIHALIQGCDIAIERNGNSDEK